MEPPTEIKNLYTYINQPMQEMHAFYIFSYSIAIALVIVIRPKIFLHLNI